MSNPSITTACCTLVTGLRIPMWAELASDKEFAGQRLIRGEQLDDFLNFTFGGAGEGQQSNDDRGQRREGVELLQHEFDFARLDFVGGICGGCGHGLSDPSIVLCAQERHYFLGVVSYEPPRGGTPNGAA